MCKSVFFLLLMMSSYGLLFFISYCYAIMIIVITLKLQKKVALPSRTMHVRLHVHMPESILCTHWGVCGRYKNLG